MTESSERRVRVRVRRNNIVMGSFVEGRIIWVNERYAKQLADAKAVDILEANFQLGPTEVKTEGAVGSSGAPPSGPSSGTAGSTETRGEAKPSAASAADHPSAVTKYPRSSARKGRVRAK